MWWFQWVGPQKCLPARMNMSQNSLTMRTWERQLTEVLETITITPNITTINIISVFKFCVIWGIFLTWFAGALIFDMMISTAFEEPVNSIDDLIERDMTLSNWQLIIIDKVDTKKDLKTRESNRVSTPLSHDLVITVTSTGSPVCHGRCLDWAKVI